MNQHRLRYLLFRIHTTVVFHIAWMDEHLRNTGDFTASNEVLVTSASSDGEGHDGRACLSFNNDASDDGQVEVRGYEQGRDHHVTFSNFDSIEIADQVIKKVHIALAEFARQPVPDNVDTGTGEAAPIGFPYNLV